MGVLGFGRLEGRAAGLHLRHPLGAHGRVPGVAGTDVHAAVHQHGDPGDEGAFVAGEEQGGVGDILGQTRLGDRLQYEIDMARELSTQPFPAAILMTLVENAIKHGIEPMKEGGTIRIAVHHAADRLVATVADTGAGLSDTIGSGVGLDNIRERLRVRYGDAAALVLAANQPRGFVARLEMPCPA